MDAKEMNKIASDVQIKKIEESIKAVAEKGKTLIEIYYHITNGAKEYFENNGFEVKLGNCVGMDYTVIKWQNV